MNNLGVVIGIAIALGLGAYFWRSKKPASPAQRIVQVLIVVAATAAGVVGGHYSAQLIDDEPRGALSVDRAIEELKKAPLLRLVIADVPGAEARIRTALDEDRQSPVARGATRAFLLMSELRVTYIVPALTSADDASALAAVAARTALLRHLQATSLAVCREFAVVGVQRVEELDTKSQEMFRATLAALEEAYRSGRNAKGAVRPVASDPQAKALLVEAGFQPADFAAMQRMDQLTDIEACSLAARINTAPSQIAAATAGSLARYLLSSQ